MASRTIERAGEGFDHQVHRLLVVLERSGESTLDREVGLKQGGIGRLDRIFAGVGQNEQVRPPVV